ncbi:MAG: aspartate/glutamate racemase family protein [Alphaproteobacteria bacterium]|nr:aspartate/glutamate racemase family protein [Alphaproteobacteria bacterium]
MKTIGLIGGMSWQSTLHYYQIINRETASRRGGLASAPLLIASVDFAPIAEMQTRNDWDAAGELLAGEARRLEVGGAHLIALATNTMHICAPRIEAAINLPFVHIADPTVGALKAHGMGRVGVLGTHFTMEERFYHDRLAAGGIESFAPGVGHTDLNAIIFEELCKGIVRDRSRKTYIEAIKRLAALGAEAVILGCTEIAMLISENDSPLPVFDTTELHAKALVDIALAE